MDFGGTSTWASSAIDVDGTPIHVYRSGRRDGPPLVFVHGLADSARCWWRVAEGLADVFDIVAIDLRNHGRSGAGGGGPERLAADLVAVVDALALDRPALIGHSLGARTVADCAVVRPDMAARLVLVDPPWPAGREGGGELGDSRREAYRRWLRWFTGSTSDGLDRFVRQQHPTWPEVEYPAWIESKQQVRTDAADTLGGGAWGDVATAITAPTLLVHGDTGGTPRTADGIVSHTAAQRATELNALIETTHIAGAGHNVHREALDDFVTIMRRWLVG